MAAELLLPFVPEALDSGSSPVHLKQGVKFNPAWKAACSFLIPLTLLGTDYLGCQSNKQLKYNARKVYFF